MSLARIQASIVNHLKDLGKLSDEQATALINSHEDLSGENLGKLLQAEHKVSDFALLTARSRAFGLCPFNARGFQADELTFQKLDRDFCREHRVLPVGMAGSYVIVALANPFNLQVTHKIQEITHQKVALLLTLESDLNELLDRCRPRRRGIRPCHPARQPHYRGSLLLRGQRHPHRTFREKHPRPRPR
ncbi:MAG: hypothetical protein ABSH19_04300 [Opitutales bacterium]